MIITKVKENKKGGKNQTCETLSITCTLLWNKRRKLVVFY